MRDETRVIVTNLVGMVVLGLGMFGIDVDAETQTEVIAGLAGIMGVANMALAAWEAKKNA